MKHCRFKPLLIVDFNLKLSELECEIKLVFGNVSNIWKSPNGYRKKIKLVGQVTLYKNRLNKENKTLSNNGYK